MGLFTSLAEQSFTTDAAHGRLFKPSGIIRGWRSRPYIIPDPETEIQIKLKLVWFYRLAWVAGVLYLAALPNIPYGFRTVMLGVFIILLILSWRFFHISAAPDLNDLARLPDKVYYPPGSRFPGLAFGLLFLCVGYILASVWKFATGDAGDGYFWLLAGLALGAVVLGIFLWRRSRSAAPA
jgi:hypothetical protein